VIFVEHPYDATVGADALVLVTEWQEYRSPDFERLRAQMRRKLLIDGRNVWSAQEPEPSGLPTRVSAWDGASRATVW
jgi:UDPglucose 6-dehydrogenase